MIAGCQRTLGHSPLRDADDSQAELESESGSDFMGNANRTKTGKRKKLVIRPSAITVIESGRVGMVVRAV